MYIKGREVSVASCSKNELEDILNVLNADILSLYHCKTIKFKVVKNEKEQILYPYQLSSREIMYFLCYFQFLYENLSYRFSIRKDIELSKEDKKLLKDYMDFDMNISKVAQKNKLHRYQVYHQFEVIKRKTGFDPGKYYDLNKLQTYLRRGHYEKRTKDRIISDK